MQDLIGVPPKSWKRRAVRKAELVTLPLFQLIPHLLIAIDVAQSPDAFSAKVGLSRRIYFQLSLPCMPCIVKGAALEGELETETSLRQYACACTSIENCLQFLSVCHCSPMSHTQFACLLAIIIVM